MLLKGQDIWNYFHSQVIIITIPLLDIGKRNSEEKPKEEIETNSAVTDEENVPSSEINSDEVAENELVDEVASNDPIAEDSEAEDKEKSS